MSGRIAVALRHVGFEDLGSFELPLREQGYDITYADVADGDLHYLDPCTPDLLVVLGGPIGVYDQEAYPRVRQEIELLRVRLAADRPTLGICLGAQLMAAALDARVYAGPVKEIGWSELERVGRPEQHLLSALDGVAVLHWHGDTFDLPQGCTRLASTPAYPNQAFARGKHVLGLQFHPEVVASRFEHWLLGHANELASAGTSPIWLRQQAEIHGDRLEEASRRLITAWLSHLDQ